MAKPKLALIPAAQGTKLYSVLPSDGVGDFTFARGSVATRINAQGLIENVASGVSRLNYPLIDGVQKGCPHHILEPERTNLIQYSESFSNAYWTKSRASVTSNALISPDGALNASKFTQTTSTAWGGVVLTITPSGASTLSIFAKKIDNDYIALIGHSSNDTKVYFNLDNGTIGTVGSDVTNADIQDYGNGWFRCVLTASSINRFTVLHAITNNGVTANLNTETSLWGAQVEVGSFTTSYIPTSGESGGVTRSAETANGAGNASTFNDSEGVLMFEGSFLSKISSPNQRIAISDGTTSNRILIQNVGSSSNRLQFYTIVNNATSTDFYTDLSDITLFNKIVFKYKINNFSVWINGFEVLTDTSGITFPNGTLTELAFDGGDGGNDFYGKTKQVQYFDSILDSQQLEQLTSWQSFTDMANGQLYTIE
jgi:hypothetical protein